MQAQGTPKLSDRQAALLTRICLKRYEVIHEGYMGSWRPNESVRVWDRIDRGASDRSFRTSTLGALIDKGLVRRVPVELGRDNSAEVKPTKAGLELFERIRSGASREQGA